MIEVNRDTRRLVMGDKELRLRRMAFEVVSYLASRPGFVRTPQQILNAVHCPGHEAEGTGDSVKQQVHHARKAIKAAFGVECIHNEYGVGYSWRV